ncbi:MAG TPA: efflux RND transporter permease subunit [Lutibacter sp.]|nr:efflux RND transporter permease subunit [Lutibacter sp.]
MRKIISYFIKYQVAVNVLILAFVVFGLFGALSLKSSFFPLTESRIITINVFYPGASPIEMEEGIVLKIEDNLKGLVGIDRVTSVSRENSANITVEIEKGRKIDVLVSDVKNAVDRVPSFPTGMEPPIIAKRENIRTTINFILSGEGVSLKTLKDYARNIENDIRGMEGISQITLSGFPNEEIEIAVRENDLLAYNLSIQQVASAVQKSNLLITGGTVKTNTEEYLIRASNRGYYAKELADIVVRTSPTGVIVRLKDIANVKDIWSENPDRVFFNGKTAINISVNNTNNEDLIGTADKIKAYIKDFNKQHQNIHINISNDTSVTLNERTKLLLKNGGMGVLLVLLFLSLFLNARLALWVAAGLPISFLGMFMFVAQTGITINVLSLFGMIIVIGILVDDGIVIGENIYHHFEKGKSRIQAAIDGTLEVIPPVVSAIITTILSFSVFFFIDGRMGDFFSEVSTVVILVLIVSLFEALIILPAHIAHSKALEVKNGKKKNAFNQFFDAINKQADSGLKWIRDSIYAPYLRYFLKNRLLGFAIPFVMLLLSMGALKAGVVKTSFFPMIASDRVQITLNMPQGTNEIITDSIIASIEKKVWLVNEEFTKKQTGNIPVIQNVIRRIGPSSRGTLTVNLLPGESRDFDSSVITSSIRKKVGRIEGVENLTFGAGRNMGGSPISVSLLSNDISQLKAAKELLKKEMSQNPQLKDITDNDPMGIKEVRIQLKESANLLGLDLRTVMSQVRNGFFGFQAQRFQRGQDEIKVWVRYTKENRLSIKNLDDMWIISPSGKRVPFAEIATYTIARGDISINHLSGKREIQVNADLKSEKDSPPDIIEGIKTDIIPLIKEKYPSVTTLYEGQNREMKKTMESLPRAGLTILALIYMVIAFTFRSYSQPILLLFMIPFSMIGVIWGHYFHDFKINILSWLGIIALVGIMVNDGLVLVTKFNGYLKEGMKYDDALVQAGISRFRAIFLTTITTVAGLMPLLLETSRQAQFLQPMAISISYGIIIATFLTLLILPLLLSFWNSVLVFFKWLRTGEEVTREEVERAIIEMEVEETNED